MGQIYFKKNAKRLKKPTQKRKKRPKKWGPNETNKSNRFLYLKNGFLLPPSVTRFGNLLAFGQLFKAFGNN